MASLLLPPRRTWRKRISSLLPWALVCGGALGCLVLVVMLWLGLRERQRAYVNARTQTVLNQFAAASVVDLDAQVAQLERLARQWADHPEYPRENRDGDASLLLVAGQQLGLLSMTEFDTNGRAVWTFPENAQNSLPSGPAAAAAEVRDQETRRKAFSDASRTGFATPAAVISGTITVRAPARGARAERGAMICAALLHDGKPTGYLTVDLAYQPFFDHLATRNLDLVDSYEVAVALASEPGDPVFATSAARHPDSDLTIIKNITIAQRRVQLSLTPTAATLAGERNYVPELALAGCCGVMVLGGFGVHLVRRSRQTENPFRAPASQPAWNYR